MKILDSWRRHRIANDNPRPRWRRRPSRAEHVMVAAVFLASVLAGATVASLATGKFPAWLVPSFIAQRAP